MKQGEWKIKHGYYLNNIRHPLYTVWINIKHRCNNRKQEEGNISRSIREND